MVQVSGGNSYLSLKVMKNTCRFIPTLIHETSKGKPTTTMYFYIYNNTRQIVLYLIGGPPDISCTLSCV